MVAGFNELVVGNEFIVEVVRRLIDRCLRVDVYNVCALTAIRRRRS